jgi:hypothetical protein
MWFEDIVGGPHSARTWCIGYHVQDFPLEAFQYFDVGDGSWTPELYSVGPDGFEDDFKG